MGCEPQESWIRSWLRDLAFDLVVAPLLAAISKHDKEIKRIMATQEQRLQAIFTKVSEAVDLLKTLKENNPALEDEIAAIENKLAEAGPAPEPPA